MSINPVQATQGPELCVVKASPRPEPRLARRTSSAQPTSGNLPKEEFHVPQNAARDPGLPRDVVQVQHDSATNGVIVIKYLDHSGKLILQVPSSQVLAMMRAIDRDFEQEAEGQANGAQR